MFTPSQHSSEILQYSENFVWSTSDNLGRGATATVYLGRHKFSGEQSAIKVFHDRYAAHFSTARLRELEMLHKVQHRNVIRLSAIEKETCTGGQVLVMELCTGGSLYEMLGEPRYSFGFPEEEFKIFLGDITAGMQYLRQNDIIHRDIKPGNIMRYIDDDGRSVYKLTDFGAARELQEEETFMSIYGTEEYLHPDMYQRAVLKRPSGQRFDASVDLWSVGVTIYHVAVGHLPFQPFGGRNNSETMHRITTEKASGVISGSQSVADGPIVWSKELPKTCLLSGSLKMQITPMIAGLLECDSSTMWTFERFFSTVRNILEMLTVKVFCCSLGTNSVIYVNRTETYSALQERLARESEISAADQLLLYNDKELWELVDMTAPMQTYPKAVFIGQLFLFHRDRIEAQKLVLREIPSYPEFTNTISLDKDLQLTQRCCAIVYLIERLTVTVKNDQELIVDAEAGIRSYIQRRIRITDNCLPDMDRILEETRKRQNTYFTTYRAVCELLDILLESQKQQSSKWFLTISECRTAMEKAINDTTLQEVLAKAERRAEEIRVYMTLLKEKINEQERNAISACVGCQEEDHCLSKVVNLRKTVCNIWNLFERHRGQKKLSSHEEFVHKSERQKLQDSCVKVVSVLQGHCMQNLNQAYAIILRNISVLTKNFARTRKVEANVTSVLECQHQLSERLDKIEGECRQTVEQIQKVLRDDPISKESPRRRVAVEQDENKSDTGKEHLSTQSQTDPVSRDASVQKLSIELQKLSVETMHLKQMIQDNTNLMKSFLKDTEKLNAGSLEQWPS